MKTPRLRSPLFGFLSLASGLWSLASAAVPATPPPGPVTTAGAVGLFEARSDLGTIRRPGSAVFDPAKKTYAVAASGANIWAAADALQFVWKKMSGDVVFSADVEFQPPTGNPGPSDNHRKAVLMLRQSLDADAPYFDVSTHGDGMTALQFRDTPAGESFEIRVSQAGPKRLRIEKHGDEATVFIADKVGENFRFTGAGHTLKLAGDFYVGLGVCSHNDANLETAVFSNVELKPGPFTATPKLYYTIETQSAASSPVTDRYALYTSTDQLGSPVWLPDNNAIAFVRDGRVMRIPVSPTPAQNANGQTLAGNPRPVSGLPMPLQSYTLHNVTRGSIALTPDGQSLAFVMLRESYNPMADLQMPKSDFPGSPILNSMSVAGGPLSEISMGANAGNSSPDGKIWIFSRRSGFGSRGQSPTNPSTQALAANYFSKIYTVPTDNSSRDPDTATLPQALGGESNPFNNYNPAFSSDGQTIYFTSDRTGSAQVWQMKAGGSEPVQLTNDENNNYFSSVSPAAPGVILFTSPTAFSFPCLPPVPPRPPCLTPTSKPASIHLPSHQKNFGRGTIAGRGRQRAG